MSTADAPSLPALPAGTAPEGGAEGDGAVAVKRSWESMRESAQHTVPDIPPIKKAAIILAAIGPEVAADFLRNMSENALTRTALAISRIDKIPKETLDSVIAEFLLSIGTEEEVSGGVNTARRLLSEVLDDNTIEKIMYDVEGGDTRKAWKKLNDCTNAALTAFIGAEHPQTAAVILSELRPDKAAAVMERLDREFAQITVLRLARVPSVDPEVSDMVEHIIDHEFLRSIQRTKRSRKPADLIASLMNNLNSDMREKMLGFLEGERPALHKDVLKTMFTFNDIRTRVNAREVSAIVKELEEPTLITALKWGQVQRNPSVDFILQNLSKRLGERIKEDLEAMPDPSPRDGEAAHQEMVRVIQEAAKMGNITLIEDEPLED